MIKAKAKAVVGALYDGGWRASDREELKKEYDLTEDEVKELCKALEEIKFEGGRKEMKESKKVTLIGLNIEVEYDDEEVYYWIEESETLEGRQTTDGRIIVWDDAHNGWIQVWRI